MWICKYYFLCYIYRSILHYMDHLAFFSFLPHEYSKVNHNWMASLLANISWYFGSNFDVWISWLPHPKHSMGSLASPDNFWRETNWSTYFPQHNELFLNIMTLCPIILKASFWSVRFSQHVCQGHLSSFYDKHSFTFLLLDLSLTSTSLTSSLTSSFSSGGNCGG